MLVAMDVQSPNSEGGNRPLTGENSMLPKPVIQPHPNSDTSQENSLPSTSATNTTAVNTAAVSTTNASYNLSDNEIQDDSRTQSHPALPMSPYSFMTSDFSFPAFVQEETRQPQISSSILDLTSSDDESFEELWPRPLKPVAIPSRSHLPSCIKVATTHLAMSTGVAGYNSTSNEIIDLEAAAPALTPEPAPVSSSQIDFVTENQPAIDDTAMARGEEFRAVPNADTSIVHVEYAEEDSRTWATATAANTRKNAKSHFQALLGTKRQTKPNALLFGDDESQQKVQPQSGGGDCDLTENPSKSNLVSRRLAFRPRVDVFGVDKSKSDEVINPAAILTQPLVWGSPHLTSMTDSPSNVIQASPLPFKEGESLNYDHMMREWASQITTMRKTKAASVVAPKRMTRSTITNLFEGTPSNSSSLGEEPSKVIAEADANDQTMSKRKGVKSRLASTIPLQSQGDIQSLITISTDTQLAHSTPTSRAKKMFRAAQKQQQELEKSEMMLLLQEGEKPKARQEVSSDQPEVTTHNVSFNDTIEKALEQDDFIIESTVSQILQRQADNILPSRANEMSEFSSSTPSLALPPTHSLSVSLSTPPLETQNQEADVTTDQNLPPEVPFNQTSADEVITEGKDNQIVMEASLVYENLLEPIQERSSRENEMVLRHHQSESAELEPNQLLKHSQLSMQDQPNQASTMKPEKSGVNSTFVANLHTPTIIPDIDFVALTTPLDLGLPLSKHISDSDVGNVTPSTMRRRSIRLSGSQPSSAKPLLLFTSHSELSTPTPLTPQPTTLSNPNHCNLNASSDIVLINNKDSTPIIMTERRRRLLERLPTPGGGSSTTAHLGNSVNPKSLNSSDRNSSSSSNKRQAVIRTINFGDIEEGDEANEEDDHEHYPSVDISKQIDTATRITSSYQGINFLDILEDVDDHGFGTLHVDEKEEAKEIEVGTPTEYTPNTGIPDCVDLESQSLRRSKRRKLGD